MDFQQAKQYLLDNHISQSDFQVKVKLTGQFAIYLGLMVDCNGDCTAIVRPIGDEQLYEYHPTQLESYDF